MSQKMMAQQPIPTDPVTIVKQESFDSAFIESEPKIDKPQQPVDDGLVVSSRTTQRVHSDRLQKIWEEINKKQPLPTKIERKDHSMNKQTSEIQKKRTQFGNVSQKGAQHITELIEVYKFRNNNRFNIDATEKIRSDLKERLVTYLLYAIEELREIHLDLSGKEVEVVALDDSQAIAYARKIAIQTQINLIRFFNKDLRGKIERNYRDRANTILVNIRDENNTELRRKVINATLQPNKLATVDEIELFTQSRRDQIYAKARQEIAQTTMPIFEQIVEPDEIIYDDIKSPQNKIERIVQNKPKNLDEKISKELRELMKKQIGDFKQKILDDLPEKESNSLLQNLKEVFPGQHN